MTLGKTFAGLACASLILSGCAVADITSEKAKTVDDCEANWLLETGAIAPDAIDRGTRADNAVMGFFVAIARAFTDPQIAHERFRNCLESVGVVDVNAFLATDSDLARELGATIKPIVAVGPPKRPAHCPPGASVLYGGSGYCVGR